MLARADSPGRIEIFDSIMIKIVEVTPSFAALEPLPEEVDGSQLFAIISRNVRQVWDGRVR
jgi:hypothetical protein